MKRFLRNFFLERRTAAADDAGVLVRRNLTRRREGAERAPLDALETKGVLCGGGGVGFGRFSGALQDGECETGTAAWRFSLYQAATIPYCDKATFFYIFLTGSRAKKPARETQQHPSHTHIKCPRLSLDHNHARTHKKPRKTVLTHYTYTRNPYKATRRRHT